MAEISLGLVEVKEFDKRYHAYAQRVQFLITALRNEAGNPKKWSSAQAEQLLEIVASITQLAAALEVLVHYNRQENRGKIRL